jgi:hypothetical protein
MPHAILRFAKLKGGKLASADRHNERKKEEYKSNPDINTAKSRENVSFMKPQGTYKKVVDARIADVGCKVRKDSVFIVETLITASPEFLGAMDTPGALEFLRLAHDFIEGRVGVTNIVSSVVHLDEKTPHLHLCFVPITEDGRLSAKDILGNQRTLSKWQTEFHAYMHEKYPDLERGVSAIETRRKHIPVWLFKQAERLDRDFEKVKATLKDVNVLNAGKKRDEALALLERWVPEARKFTAQVKTVDLEMKGLKTEAQGTRNYADVLNGDIRQLHAENQDLAFKRKKAEQAASELYRKLERTEKLLAKVPDEVMKQIKRSDKQRGFER